MSATELLSKLQSIFDSDWNLTKNEGNSIVYTSTKNTFEEFRVNIEKTKINVVVPMPGSEVLYQTNMYTHDEVCEYIRSHLAHIREINEETENSHDNDEI
jgi:hypothetical protein